VATTSLILRRVATFGVALSLLACAKGESAEAGDTTLAADADSDADAPAARSVSLPVAVSEVRDGDLVLSISTTGQVRADGEATLKSEVSGTIERVLVRPGDRVRRGQPLIRLDPRPFDLNVKEAEAAVAEAEIRYVDAIAPDSIVLGRAPTDEQRRIALARSGLPAARVRLDKAKLERERAIITAPFDGMVDRVDRTTGERVQAGETLTRVVNLAALRIEASVLEHDLPLIRQGGQATVTSASVPDRSVPGRVTAVLPVIDTTTRAGRVFVSIPSSGPLRPGMYADVRLESQRLRGRRLVPSRAVIERDGRPLVFVVKDGRAQWVYITPGRSNGADTEVLPDSSTGIIPVEVGDHVIVEGHLTLTHDAPVREVVADTAKRTGKE
jgi:membrane fusion protein (multidrug efflux system)